MEPNPVIDAIKARRHALVFRADKPVDRELVEQVLTAATWAPSHHQTEPWRFLVIAGEERGRLGEALADALVSTSPGGVPRERVDRERTKPLSAPVVVALLSSPRRGEKVVPQEEVLAVGASLQNLLLAAHSLGLASRLVTGPLAYSEAVRRYLGLEESESLACFVYIGYPDEEPRAGRRGGLSEKVSWRGL